MTDKVSSVWRDAWRDPALRAHIVATPIGLLLTLRALAVFLCWVEDRPGTRLSDPLLMALAPRDHRWFIFAMIYLALTVGLGVLVSHPRAMVIGVQAYAVMLLARICVMYFTALDPPIDTIVLRDPFIEMFGPGRVLTRDLFFSGHTATVFLVFLAVPNRRLKPLFLACTVAVAVGVLWQHVHYTVDVLVAPVFAFASYRAVVAMHDLTSRGIARNT